MMLRGVIYGFAACRAREIKRSNQKIPHYFETKSVANVAVVRAIKGWRRLLSLGRSQLGLYDIDASNDDGTKSVKEQKAAREYRYEQRDELARATGKGGKERENEEEKPNQRPRSKEKRKPS
jgi:hypothetical protein